MGGLSSPVVAVAAQVFSVRAQVVGDLLKAAHFTRLMPDFFL